MAGKVARSLSLFGAVATIVGLVVGASIFVLVPGLAGMCGPSLWLAYLLSSIPAIFAALYLIQLGAALPVTGANYIAVTRWLSPMAGFSSSLVTLVAIVSTNCIVAWGFAQYLADMLPLIPPLLTAIGIIILFGVINWVGVKTFEMVQIVMFLAFLAAMLMFGEGGTIQADSVLTNKTAVSHGSEKFLLCNCHRQFFLGRINRNHRGRRGDKKSATKHPPCPGPFASDNSGALCAANLRPDGHHELA